MGTICCAPSLAQSCTNLAQRCAKFACQHEKVLGVVDGNFPYWLRANLLKEKWCSNCIQNLYLGFHLEPSYCMASITFLVLWQNHPHILCNHFGWGFKGIHQLLLLLYAATAGSFPGIPIRDGHKECGA